MTVLTSYTPLLYSGNGATQLFGVTWPFFSGSLVVTRLVSDVETELTINVDYTVTGGTDGEGKPGLGSVIFGTAPASGTQIRIERDTPLTQGSTWDESDNFPQAVVEAGFDKSILIAQEIAGKDWSGPKGDKGDEGPANTLSIGTVTKGDDADASITGAAPSQILNLVLPKGDQGEPGFKPVQVDELSDRDAYDDEDEGFSILVSDVGDGRAAIYSKNSNASADWSDPAYVTGEQGSSGASAAEDITYDPSASGLSATDVQGAIDELAAGKAPVSVVIDQRVQTLMLAEFTGEQIFLGPDGSALHDPFDTLDYVDTDGATNLDTSEVGVLKPSALSADQESSTPATANSSNSGNTVIDRSWALTNGRTISHIGVYSITAASCTVKVVRRVSSETYDILVSETFSHGGTGWEDFELSSPYEIPGSGSIHLGMYAAWGSGTAAVAQSKDRAVVGSNITGSGQNIPESNGNITPVRASLIAEIDSLDVASIAVETVGEPSAISLVAFVTGDEVFNSDAVLSVSRDEGEHWASATMAHMYDQPGGVRVLKSNAVDVSEQDPGSNVQWRLETSNGADIALRAIAIWAD